MNHYRNLGLFVLLGAIWGGAYPVIKIGVAANPPIQFAALRYDIAGVLMVAYVAITSDYWRPRSAADWINVSISGLLIIAAYNAFIFVGEQTTPSAIAGILVGLMPIFSAGFSKVLLPQERLDLLDVVGIVSGFLGIVVIAGPSTLSSFTTSFAGQLLVIAAAVSMALGSVLTERVAATQPVETLEAWSMVFGAVILHAVVTIQSGTPLVALQWTTTSVTAMLYLAVLSSAVAYFLYFDLLSRLGPIHMNFIAYVAAGFGVLFGGLLLDERIGISSLIGFGAIVAGFLVLKRQVIHEQYLDWTESEEILQ